MNTHKVQLEEIDDYTVRAVLAISVEAIEGTRTRSKVLEVVTTQHDRWYEISQNDVKLLSTRYLYIAVQEYNKLS